VSHIVLWGFSYYELQPTKGGVIEVTQLLVEKWLSQLTERLNNLPQIIQLVPGSAEIQEICP
jgi:predicted nucleic acid-binding Zn ribbon protein